MITTSRHYLPGYDLCTNRPIYYIEPDVPHEVFNLSDSEPAVAVIARSAADEKEQKISYERS